MAMATAMCGLCAVRAKTTRHARPFQTRHQTADWPNKRQVARLQHSGGSAAGWTLHAGSVGGQKLMRMAMASHGKILTIDAAD